MNKNNKIDTFNEVLKKYELKNSLTADMQDYVIWKRDISLKKGQNFRKGDVLVKIYNKDAKYALQARKSGYLNLLANILPDLKIDYPEYYESWVNFFESVKIDTDLPDLPASLVRTAFEQLETYDTVIGPSDDGGYYLIGFRKAAWLPDVFYDMVWSTADVYMETTRKITEAGRTVYPLSEWSDIDDYRDLQQFYKRTYDRQGRASHTVAYLKHHHIV